MDYCLLEDAFKNEVGCVDKIATTKAQKHERKKMKKNRDYFKSVDPTFSPEAIDANCPASKDYSEAFQNAEIKVPEIPKKEASSQLPSYFLGLDDVEEGFTSDFSKEPEKGFEKASGNELPTPSLDDTWKPLTPASGNSAYFKSLPTPGGTYPLWNALQYEPRELKSTLKETSSTDTPLQKKIDELQKRLAELEKQYTYKPTNQEEILAFVGTGIFIIFGLSMLKC